MVALRDEVDETVGLHELLPTYERAVVDQVESRQELRRHYTDIGVPIALTHGAPGKAMLCTLPWSRQKAALARGIEAVTDRTVTDPTALAAELATARQRGWAGSDAERTPGIRAVAAPVFDHTGMVVGALGLSVPTVRMDDARAGELGRRAAAVAWDVSEALGATRSLVDQKLALATDPDRPGLSRGDQGTSTSFPPGCWPISSSAAARASASGNERARGTTSSPAPARSTRSARTDAR